MQSNESDLITTFLGSNADEEMGINVQELMSHLANDLFLIMATITAAAAARSAD